MLGSQATAYTGITQIKLKKNPTAAVEGWKESPACGLLLTLDHFRQSR
jgi:hypothetical protein